MSNEIICAIIDLAGTVLAAIIGLGWLGKILDRNIHTYFFAYSDKKHSLRRIMHKAKDNITIVVVYGDHLLNEYEENIASYLKSGIRIRYLMLDPKHALLMDREYCKQEPELAANNIEMVLDKLGKLKEADKQFAKELSIITGNTERENLEIRVFDTFLSASYIGIDIFEDETDKFKSNSIIQVMLYQLGLDTPNAPITYFSPKKNPKQFKNSVNCIEEMWARGRTLDMKKYKKQLRKEVEKYKT